MQQAAEVRERLRLSFEIPGLPKRTNNNGGHWRTRQKEAKRWKKLVILCVSNIVSVHDYGIFGSLPLVKAKLTLTRFSSVEPDFDGLVSSFKHVIDGLILANVIESDKMSVIGQPTYLWQKVSPKQGKIRVEVEEVMA